MELAPNPRYSGSS